MANKKPIVKSLSAEIEIMKKELLEVTFLKTRIIELEETVKLLKSNKIVVNEKENGSKMNKNCLKCDKSFDSKRSLRDHINEENSMTNNCNLCDKHFSRSCDLHRDPYLLIQKCFLYIGHFYICWSPM